MSDPITTVFYSIQRVGSFGVLPSPINSPQEKAMAEAEAKQTIVVTWGDLKIVVFVCGDIADDEVYRQVNGIKQIVIGQIPPEMRLARSRYSEVGGVGYIDDVLAEEFDDDDLA